MAEPEPCTVCGYAPCAASPLTSSTRWTIGGAARTVDANWRHHVAKLKAVAVAARKIKCCVERAESDPPVDDPWDALAAALAALDSAPRLTTDINLGLTQPHWSPEYRAALIALYEAVTINHLNGWCKCETEGDRVRTDALCVEAGEVARLTP